MSDLYGKTANYFFDAGVIQVETAYDNKGNDWKSGATSWNRNCNAALSGDGDYRGDWYSDTLDSFTCWVHDQPQFTGALTQLLHGCAWNTGGTVGLAWIGVTCRGSSFEFDIDGVLRCAGKGSVSNYASSALYLIASHELGHNFGLNHEANGVMTSSSGAATDFSKTSQSALCTLYPGILSFPFLPFPLPPSPSPSSFFLHSSLLLFTDQAGICAVDYIEGCDCPASWECGSLCGSDCPGLSCPAGDSCVNNVCVTPCVPQCGPMDSFECGADGCGGNCGECAGNPNKVSLFFFL